MGQILAAFLQSPSRGKVLQTRLCLTLATFFLHAVPAYWSGAISDLFRRVGHAAPSLGQLAAQNLLLEFLTVIPEQIERDAIAKKQRQAAIREILEAKEMVLGFLNGILQAPPSELSVPALECLTSWLKYHCTVAEGLPFAPLALRMVSGVCSVSLRGVS